MSMWDRFKSRVWWVWKYILFPFLMVGYAVLNAIDLWDGKLEVPVWGRMSIITVIAYFLLGVGFLMYVVYRPVDDDERD